MNENSTVAFGFWVYLMTDLVLFAGLFAVFTVLRGNIGTGEELFSTPIVLIETFALLLSSFTCGIAFLAAKNQRKFLALGSLLATFALGAIFVGLELSEFARDIANGMGPSQSGLTSSYFVLVGTHGLHVTIALLWMLVLGIAIALRGFTEGNARKLLLLTLFWHFLDIVWICIFTIVYLLALL